ncbi:28S ribosomal protein S22, mitochondrial [Cephus cinctus]|uniref:28S ribosomal protein S22, mitochondrial n=1 Tax=Cephus cinctus TaxID=211228 RepID=A0AAJ7BHW9_CEPCN|nr:28S ribosomal protein S22, mitochondrial [Cephus cinctus]
MNMFLRKLNTFLRNSQCSSFIKYRAFSSKVSETGSERDPAPLFFNEEIQNLLYTLTRVDLKKVFRPQRDGQQMEPPTYKFLTTRELEKAMKSAKRKAETRLQMPPVVKKRSEVTKIISTDPALESYDRCNYVFTDITYGISNYDRLIVVREPNGVLRHAKWDERHCLNQIYFPMPGREIIAPRMFEQEFLEDLLNRQEYDFVLNRACLQFEPNDPKYIEISEKVYSIVNEKQDFEILRSTRHYGPMLFYLAWNKNIDNLLLENIQTEKIEDAVLFTKLYHKINPTASSVDIAHEGDDIQYLREFVKSEAANKGKLEAAILSYKELEKERQSVAKGIQKAHGIE